MLLLRNIKQSLLHISASVKHATAAQHVSLPEEMSELLGKDLGSPQSQPHFP